LRPLDVATYINVIEKMGLKKKKERKEKMGLLPPKL